MQSQRSKEHLQFYDVFMIPKFLCCVLFKSKEHRPTVDSSSTRCAAVRILNHGLWKKLFPLPDLVGILTQSFSLLLHQYLLLCHHRARAKGVFKKNLELLSGSLHLSHSDGFAPNS